MWNWRGTAAGQPAPLTTAISKRRRFEAVSKVVQQLPVELHASQEDMRHMSLPELKVIGKDINTDNTFGKWMYIHCAEYESAKPQTFVLASTP